MDAGRLGGAADTVFEIKVDQTHAIIDFVLAGIVQLPEMKAFARELREATLTLAGREIKIKADVRALKPASSEVADMIREVQEFGLRTGVKRVAEIVESDIVALQLNRVARESGTDKILRRFWEDESAREWLIVGDSRDSRDGSVPPPSSRRSRPPSKP